jgi:hypothetical protein
VDLADAPQWPNKHLLPPWVDDKSKVSKMMPHLRAFINHVITLHKASLKACHCAEEFILRWIRLLDQREKLAYKCPWFPDLTYNPSSGKTLIFTQFSGFHIVLS